MNNHRCEICDDPTGVGELDWEYCHVRVRLCWDCTVELDEALSSGLGDDMCMVSDEIKNLKIALEYMTDGAFIEATLSKLKALRVVLMEHRQKFTQDIRGWVAKKHEERQ